MMNGKSGPRYKYWSGYRGILDGWNGKYTRTLMMRTEDKDRSSGTQKGGRLSDPTGKLWKF